MMEDNLERCGLVNAKSKCLSDGDDDAIMDS